MAVFPRLKNRQICLLSFIATLPVCCTDFVFKLLAGMVSMASSSFLARYPHQLGQSLAPLLDPPSLDGMLLHCWNRRILMYRLAGRYTLPHLNWRRPRRHTTASIGGLCRETATSPRIFPKSPPLVVSLSSELGIGN